MATAGNDAPTSRGSGYADTWEPLPDILSRTAPGAASHRAAASVACRGPGVDDGRRHRATATGARSPAGDEFRWSDFSKGPGTIRFRRGNVLCAMSWYGDQASGGNLARTIDRAIVGSADIRLRGDEPEVPGV